MARKPKEIKGEKGKPIKGVDARRDSNSGAVVFNDNAGYQRAVKRKRTGRRLVLQENKIKSQERKIESLEARLEQLEQALSGGN